MTIRAIPVAIGLTVVTAALVPASAEQHHHWSYSGEGGPSHWAELDAKNAACGEGKSQSPVNIRTQDVRRTQLPKLMFNYQPAPLHIIDNGHSVQINVEPGSVLKVGGQDCHAEVSGAYTGDISVGMLAAAGASYVILGHSERCADHGETDSAVYGDHFQVKGHSDALPPMPA